MRIRTLVFASALLVACRDNPPPLPESTSSSGMIVPTVRPTVLTPVSGSRPYKGPGGLEARIEHLESQLADLEKSALRTTSQAQYDALSKRMKATQKELDAAKAELAARDAGP